MTETRMERNRRARAYSHACRIRRLRNALWAVAAVLTVLLAVELIWLLSSRPAPEGTAQEPQEMVVDILMSHEDAAAAGARRELVTWKTDLRQGETPS